MNKQRDYLKLKPEWIIFKYRVDKNDQREAEPYAIEHIDGNLALNEGITELCDLIAGTEGTTAVLFDNANAYIGVGDDDTAADAAQTGLIAATNKTYIAMDATYPQRSSQTIIWQATFGTSDANYAWKEFTVANGNSNSAVNLNRKVDSRGTKDSSMSWTVQLKITIG